MQKAKITLRPISDSGYMFQHPTKPVTVTLTKAALAEHDNDLSQLAISHECQVLRNKAAQCIRLS